MITKNYNEWRDNLHDITKDNASIVIHDYYVSKEIQSLPNFLGFITDNMIEDENHVIHSIHSQQIITDNPNNVVSAMVNLSPFFLHTVAYYPSVPTKLKYDDTNGLIVNTELTMTQAFWVIAWVKK